MFSILDTFSPFSLTKVKVSFLMLIFSSPLLKFNVESSLSDVSKITLEVCFSPWFPVVLEFSPVGSTGVIFGVYVVSTVIPFSSSALTIAGITSPT